MPEEIEVIGHFVQVRVNKFGEPICPSCEVAMVSADGGATWSCPIGGAARALAVEALTEAFDRAVLHTWVG